jgi:hypothetical protein
MAGHRRSKNGVVSLAYVPAIHVFATTKQDVDARDERGHDGMSLDCPLSRAMTEAGAQAFHCAVSPPSSTSVWPVTEAAASLAR